jgi:hypothetical protein
MAEDGCDRERNSAQPSRDLSQEPNLCRQRAGEGICCQIPAWTRMTQRYGSASLRGVGDLHTGEAMQRPIKVGMIVSVCVQVVAERGQESELRWQRAGETVVMQRPAWTRLMDEGSEETWASKQEVR